LDEESTIEELDENYEDCDEDLAEGEVEDTTED
jgi:hypothetical protein